MWGAEGLCVAAGVGLRTSQASHNRRPQTLSVSSPNIEGPTHRARSGHSEKRADHLLQAGPALGSGGTPPTPH